MLMIRLCEKRNYTRFDFDQDRETYHVDESFERTGFDTKTRK